jgi:hypothetical protein
LAEFISLGVYNTRGSYAPDWDSGAGLAVTKVAMSSVAMKNGLNFMMRIRIYFRKIAGFLQPLGVARIKRRDESRNENHIGNKHS